MDKFVLYKVFSKTCGPCKLLENNLVDANIYYKLLFSVITKIVLLPFCLTSTIIF